MNPLAAILTLLVGVNASFELARNVRRTNEARRKRLVDRAGRNKIRMVARKLERLGGPGAKVRSGLDHDADPAVVVVRWRKASHPPTTFLGYPVMYFPTPGQQET